MSNSVHCVPPHSSIDEDIAISKPVTASQIVEELCCMVVSWIPAYIFLILDHQVALFLIIISKTYL